MAAALEAGEGVMREDGGASLGGGRFPGRARLGEGMTGGEVAGSWGAGSLPGRARPGEDMGDTADD